MSSALLPASSLGAQTGQVTGNVLVLPDEKRVEVGVAEQALGPLEACLAKPLEVGPGLEARPELAPREVSEDVRLRLARLHELAQAAGVSSRRPRSTSRSSSGPPASMISSVRKQALSGARSRLLTRSSGGDAARGSGAGRADTARRGGSLQEGRSGWGSLRRAETSHAHGPGPDRGRRTGERARKDSPGSRRHRRQAHPRRSAPGT